MIMMKNTYIVIINLALTINVYLFCLKLFGRSNDQKRFGIKFKMCVRSILRLYVESF